MDVFAKEVQNIVQRFCKTIRIFLSAILSNMKNIKELDAGKTLVRKLQHPELCKRSEAYRLGLYPLLDSVVTKNMLY